MACVCVVKRACEKNRDVEKIESLQNLIVFTPFPRSSTRTSPFVVVAAEEEGLTRLVVVVVEMVLPFEIGWMGVG